MKRNAERLFYNLYLFQVPLPLGSTIKYIYHIYMYIYAYMKIDEFSVCICMCIYVCVCTHVCVYDLQSSPHVSSQGDLNPWSSWHLPLEDPRVRAWAEITHGPQNPFFLPSF